MMDDAAALRELMDERDIRYQQRWESGQEEVRKALISINERLAMLNELRSGVATSAELDALEKIINALATRVQVLETTRTVSKSQVNSIYAAIGAAVAVIGVIVLLANKLIH